MSRLITDVGVDEEPQAISDLADQLPLVGVDLQVEPRPLLNTLALRYI